MTLNLQDLQRHATSLKQAGRYEEARDAYLLLGETVPHAALYWFQVGRCSEILGEYEVARVAFRKSIDGYAILPNQPDMARSYFGMGAALFRLGDSVNGEAFWREGLEKACDSHAAIYERSQVKLCLGQYTEDAWTDYEARKQLHGYQRSIAARTQGMAIPPEWDGKSQGRVLCIGAQGAGDVIMFSRYLPIVEERSGKRPVLAAGSPLTPLLGHDGLPRNCDYSAHLDSLPLLLGMHGPTGDHRVVTRDRRGGHQGTRAVVGVCWRGATGHLNDRDRSCPTDFRPLLAGRWVLASLQVGAGFAPADYAETAQHVTSMDAIVAVDTSIAHVAGALSVPTILIPPSSPEWRWGLGDATPWYPSIRIVRRKHVSDWAGALSRAKVELLTLVEK